MTRPSAAVGHSSFTRRTAFASVAALAVAPALAAPAQAAPPKATLIGALWAEAEALTLRLAGYRAAITAAAEDGGISGWMRLGGEANRLGAARYERLVAILNSPAETTGDLAIMARVVQDEEFRNGARGFAAEKLAEATLGMFTAAA